MEESIITNKKSSIIRKILVGMVSCIVSVAIVLGAVSAISGYISTQSALKKSLSETTKLASVNITKELKSNIISLDELASDALFVQEPLAVDKVKLRLEDFKTTYSLKDVNFADANGITQDGKNISAEDYFVDSKIYLKSTMTDVIVDGSNAYIIFSSPIVANNEFKGIVFSTMDATQLSTMTNKIKIGNKGSSFILNRSGDMIANKDFKLVVNKTNYSDKAKDDKSLKHIAEIHGKMTGASSGVDTYKDNGKSKLIAYAPILDTEGWSIAVELDKWEFLSSVFISLLVTLIASLLVALFAAFISKKIAVSLAKPILVCVDRIKLLAEGDVTTEVEVFDSDDETGILARQTSKTVRDLNYFITSLSSSLAEIADGNLSINFTDEFSGDFGPIGDAIRDIIGSMNAIIKRIQEFSQIVSSGSEQVASASQTLAQGATEQASAVEELAATIEEISQKVNSNAQNARGANTEVDKMSSAVEQSNGQMRELMTAMTEINESSDQISKILKTIEDISFQTNILALNAAIEAARAGSAGRGFSVVADEVRSLAEKCSDAAKETAELVQTSIKSVDNGSKIAKNTAKSLNQVVENAKVVTSAIGKISEASDDQAVAITQITRGVDQIAGVVQHNSATAQESAAASSELKDQAKKLQDLVANFQVSEGETSYEKFKKSPPPLINADDLDDYPALDLDINSIRVDESELSLEAINAQLSSLNSSKDINDIDTKYFMTDDENNDIIAKLKRVEAEKAEIEAKIEAEKIAKMATQKKLKSAKKAEKAEKLTEAKIKSAEKNKLNKVMHDFKAYAKATFSKIDFSKVKTLFINTKNSIINLFKKK